jgi:hypothetical protein
MFRFIHHHQGACYLSLLKLQLLKQSVKIQLYSWFGGVAANFIRSVLVCVCVVHTLTLGFNYAIEKDPKYYIKKGMVYFN